MLLRIAMGPVILVGSATISGEDFGSSNRAPKGQGFVDPRDRAPAGYTPLLPYGCDQLLDTDDINGAFEIIDQDGEAHFSSYAPITSGNSKTCCRFIPLL